MWLRNVWGVHKIKKHWLIFKDYFFSKFKSFRKKIAILLFVDKVTESFFAGGDPKLPPPPFYLKSL